MKHWMVCATVGFAVSAFGAEIHLPADTARLTKAKGVEIAETYCYTCHSVDYVSTQPSGMSKDFWKGVVVKMKDVYGAPIPPEQVNPIAAYLYAAYGDAK